MVFLFIGDFRSSDTFVSFDITKLVWKVDQAWNCRYYSEVPKSQSCWSSQGYNKPSNEASATWNIELHFPKFKIYKFYDSNKSQ